MLLANTVRSHATAARCTFFRRALRQLRLQSHRHTPATAVTAVRARDFTTAPRDSAPMSVPSTTTSSGNLPAKLIDLEVAAKIEGEESQIATVHLSPGETLRAESGAMIFMTPGIEMDTTLGGAGGSGALSGAMKRMLTGQNVFLTDFTYTGSSEGSVALGTDFPSKIIRLNLDELPEHSLVCQRGAYLASNPSVEIEMEFTKRLTTGFFGGEGFILQKLSGQGDVLVKGGGTIVVHDLAPGETLRVTTGSLVCFERTVDYDVQMVSGIKNAMFGGEGLFLTSLTGPGRVWLQGMPPDRMISEITRRVPRGGGIGLGIPIGGGGGSGEAEAADVAGTEGVDEAATGGGVPLTEEAVEADRAATVASSGAGEAVDSESSSALFGDAVPEDAVASSSDGGDASVMSESDPFGQEDSFNKNETTFEDEFAPDSSQFEEPTFDDGDFSTGGEGSSVADGELFDDTMGGGEDLEDTMESASSILKSVFDFFMGDD